MQVRPQQNDIAMIKIARGGIRDLERRHRRAMGLYRVLETARVGVRVSEPQDGVALRDAVLNRRPVVEPDMRQSPAGPCRRMIFAEQMLWPARNVHNYG